MRQTFIFTRRIVYFRKSFDLSSHSRYSSTIKNGSNDDSIREEIFGRERIYTSDENLKWTWNEVGGQYGLLSGYLSSYLTSMFLPIKYPSSVHSCYLRFHMWQATETYIGAIVSVLCNQAMLTSLGVSSHVATAGAVATQWVLKDGIAEIGKLLFIKRNSRSFDSHPKSWKATGEVLTALGSGLQLCTLYFPAEYFLSLAAGGNILKSISWALWGATHMWFVRNFALRNNIGDLTAKSDAQGALAQISGWMTGVGLITFSHSPSFLFATYLLLAPLHAICTINLLKSAQFSTLNQAKAVWIVQEFIVKNKIYGTTDKLSGVGTFGEFMKKEAVVPKVQLGCSITDVFQSIGDARVAIETIRNENYIFGINEDQGKHLIGVVLHKEAEVLDVLKALLHSLRFSHLLRQHSIDIKRTGFNDPIVTELLSESHSWTNSEFPSFVTKLEAVDWEAESLTFDDPGYRAIWKKMPRNDKIII